MNDDDLDLDVEETSPAPEATSLDASRWQKEVEKLRKENQSLRVRFRRTEMEKEYGADILELVPEDIPLEKQGEIAAKLAERLRSTTPTQTEAPNEAEAVTPQVEITEAERNLAAVAKGTDGSGTPGQLSPEDALARAKADPEWLARELSAGRNPLPRLNIGKDRVQSDWEP